LDRVTVSPAMSQALVIALFLLAMAILGFAAASLVLVGT